MAKWGEGDPRWIVEERADATNVNNWHWTEKNATQWSKDQLKSLIERLKIEDDQFEGEIEELKTLEGEAYANNRKAKLIFFYEWQIKGNWKAKKKGSKTAYKGKFEIDNLSEENTAEEIDVSFVTDSSKNEAHDAKEFMRKVGQDKIREKLGVYIKTLKEEYGKDLILPAKDAKTPDNNCTATPISDGKKVLAQPVTAQPQTSVNVKIVCKKLVTQEEFKCNVTEIYRALTDTDMVKAFTRGGVVEYSAMKGERFSLFGGNVTGQFVDLKRNEEIEMRWRFKTWPDEHYSHVTLKFEQKDDCSIVHVKQTGIPEKEYERTREGWKQYYWESIKQTFGYGSRLL